MAQLTSSDFGKLHAVPKRSVVIGSIKSAAEQILTSPIPHLACITSSTKALLRPLALTVSFLTMPADFAMEPGQDTLQHLETLVLLLFLLVLAKQNILTRLYMQPTQKLFRLKPICSLLVYTTMGRIRASF